MVKSIVLILAAAIVPFSAGFAEDGESKTLQNNTYQRFGQANCAYAGDCAILFPATTDTETVITNVSCGFAAATGVIVSAAQIGTQDFEARFFLPIFVYSLNDSGYQVLGINSTTKFFLNKGQVPRIDLGADGGPVLNLGCTISGYHS